MKATVVDLRYRMRDVIKALDRQEDVQVLSRGKLKGVLSAPRISSKGKVREHPFFGSSKDSRSVQHLMNALRGGRFRDL